MKKKCLTTYTPEKFHYMTQLLTVTKKWHSACWHLIRRRGAISFCTKNHPIYLERVDEITRGLRQHCNEGEKAILLKQIFLKLFIQVLGGFFCRKDNQPV
jgi:hypothetical protein